ncbi:putative transmembrane protein [Hirsutella rhossiliensis]|uniref:Transmembrane protein n=1 Tax=Hirsutella rhossiliensis TaxID=111463 RepID=A0A9P8SEI1_9HYPO|nr:putative transmembrane protein [Hirsutella rhossiliensis]KAH0958415.1 putative transmembrane protein [Hirsutella rhossiliensis]
MASHGSWCIYKIICTAITVALFRLSVASDLNHQRPAGLDASTQDAGALNGYLKLPHGKEEGEAHGAIEPPKSSRLVSVQVGSGREEIPAFYANDSADHGVQHVYITFHGKHRDGGAYWAMMNEAIRRRRGKRGYGTDRNTVVVAPQFLSTIYNSDQYTGNQLAWTDLNAWQAGSRANHPPRTKLTPIDALEAIVETFANQTRYPRMQNVTVFGHGGGGQLAQRYSAVGKEAPPHIHVRYIHGDASTSIYFTKDRPAEQGSTSACKRYNTWRYGFDEFPGTSAGSKTAKEYFRRYISRDVVSIVGVRDVKSNGDQSCMAKLQGGRKRRGRNLAWYKYVHALAQTGEDVDGFPGQFDSLPDWSAASNHSIRLRLTAVEDVSHDATGILESRGGQSALFSDGHVELGWRPGHRGSL